MATLTPGPATTVSPLHSQPGKWWVEVVRSADALEAHRPAWDDLAWQALEPNPFYESWMLLPALRSFAPPGGLLVALVYRDGPRPQDPPVLCGLFPLAMRRLGRLPLHAWSLWHHHYCCSCVPLLRQDAAREALLEFWNWLQHRAGGPALWELPLVCAEGPFLHAFADALNERQALFYVLRRYTRALLRPAESAEAYCAASMTSHNRQELRRRRRRLTETGQVEVRNWPPDGDLDGWIEQFLRLEDQSWKGREGTAFASSSVDAEFFRTVVRSAAERRQAVFLGLFLDGRPIALKLNLLSGEGSFSFKIAYDEQFAKFSPGVLLELENIEWMHRQPGVRWMDSCAKPGHFMINRLWRERRAMEHLIVSTGRRRGNLLVGVLPLLRALKAAVKP
jgi:hypothetical protein